MPVLTGIDVLGIQGYVFASNRLRDVLAASWMVDQITSEKQLRQWPGQEPSHVLLAAGGNAILEFDSLAAARRWTACYSRWLQDAAPGLEAVVAHRAFERRPLAWALKALQVDLARAKLERRPSVPQLGLSVTAPCVVTGLPATDVDQGEPVSPRVERLRQKVEQAKARWKGFLPALEHAPDWTAEFPDELDFMGRSYGEASLVGIVHVDVNHLGETIRRWLDRCIEDRLGSAEVRERYRRWSSRIDQLGRRVLRAVAQRTAARVRESEGRWVLDGTPHDLGFRLNDWRVDSKRRMRPRTVCLPLRPVLLGGDDLTFVCDGRIALDLAAAALQELASHPIPDLADDGGEATLTACAGVALVKAHAPFHRSYGLAEDLCRSAKRARAELNRKQGVETGCWLDWHVGSARPGEAVADIRDRAYRAGDNILSLRPYPLAAAGSRSRSWQWLDEKLLGPGRSATTAGRGFRRDPGWLGSRSRVKRLAMLARRGAAEIESQLQAWRAVDAGLRLPAALPDGGYVGPRTPILDAIELMDLHLRLEPDSAESEAPPAPPAGGAAKEPEA